MADLRECTFKIFDRKDGWSEPQEGYFHEWGTEVYDSGENLVQETIAIIEDTAGVVHKIIPSKVEFKIPTGSVVNSGMDNSKGEVEFKDRLKGLRV